MAARSNNYSVDDRNPGFYEDPNPSSQGTVPKRYENLSALERQQQANAHQSTQKPQQQQQTNKWKFILCVVAIALFCILSIAFLILIYKALTGISTASKGLSNQTTSAITTPQTYRSCWELKMNGFQLSGIYTIKPSHFPSFQVYCDMTSAGGGWTLVASIHHDNVNKKCTTFDKWASPSPNGTSSFTAAGSTSWYSGGQFGTLSSCLAADFKSQAYYNVPATDVMISHVPDNLPLQEIATSSFLTYYTSNQFLFNRGGTLQRFFRQHVSLNSLTILGMNLKILKRVTEAPALYSPATFSKFPGIQYKSVSPGFTFFPTSTANPTVNYADNGVSVHFSLNNQPYTLMKTDQVYSDGKNYNIQAKAAQPFLLLAGIANQEAFNQFRLKVTWTASSTMFSYCYARNGQYSHKGYNILYHNGYQESVPPRMSELFFVVIAPQKWNAANFDFTVTTQPANANKNRTTVVRLGNTTRNTLLGYMFIPIRTSGLQPGEVQTLINVVVDQIDLLNITDSSKPPGITVGVNLFKGIINYTSANVQPGFIQFPAYDVFGYNYAMCPGVKLGSSVDPALYCVGSANSKRNHPSRCGDFAAWEQLPDHLSWNRNPFKGGKFVNDLHSTLLVFTRSKNLTTTL